MPSWEWRVQDDTSVSAWNKAAPCFAEALDVSAPRVFVHFTCGVAVKYCWDRQDNNGYVYLSHFKDKYKPIVARPSAQINLAVEAGYATDDVYTLKGLHVEKNKLKFAVQIFIDKNCNMARARTEFHDALIRKYACVTRYSTVKFANVPHASNKKVKNVFVPSKIIKTVKTELFVKREPVKKEVKVKTER